MDVKLVSPYWELRVTVTGVIHAYLKTEYGGSESSRPTCGIGPSKFVTEAVGAPAGKQIDVHCDSCVKSLHEKGDVYIMSGKKGVA